MSVTAIQRNDLLEILNRTWGEDEDTLDALIAFIDDYDTIKDIITYDLSGNRYTCVCTWQELASEIINDEALDNYKEKDFLNRMFENTATIKYYLIRQGWCLDTENSVAILFDDNIDIVCYEV